ncbi:MAG: glycoside hydrolase family 28 protein [Planctomycetota bacterium]|jgi:polygalacturonase
MSKAKYWISIALLCLFTTACVYGAENIYDVRDYGARPDGKTMCTKSIQKAIDECAKQGGGTVYFPPGTFLSGTIYMKSKVTLKFDSGSTLLGSTNLKDYPPTVQAFRSYTDNYTDKSLIYGEKLKNIAITGNGTIDGRGRAFKGPYMVRPYMIRFIQCQNVMVKDVTIQNSPMWVQHYLACDDVLIDGITVRSHVNSNNDGINIDCCHRAIISNCNIISGDDAIVLKSTAARSCRNVTVSNCVLSSLCNGLKMGTESNGGFQNIVMTGCAIYDTRLAGIALEIVDGGTMDRIVVSNIAMNGVGAPIFLRLGNRARPFKKDMEKPKIGAMRNITISNIEATGANPTGCAISGLPSHAIENVTISNVRLSFAGGGTKKDSVRAVPENPTAYPEYSMFGKLPAYGLYCRHVKGLKLRNIQLQLVKSDRRHALVAEDCENISIDDLDAPFSQDASAMIQLTDIKGALIRGCRAQAGTDTFLKLQGPLSEGVVLTANDFSRVDRIAEKAPDLPKTALSLLSNHTAEKP